MNIKSEIINFLYCFDKNYNSQAFTSIISLLDNVQTCININIIHKNEVVITDVPENIRNHSKLNDLNIYKFKDSEHNFPNLNDAHVSEATYYRLFIQNYLLGVRGIIIYLDADTVIVNDPTKLFLKYSKQLKDSGYIFGARTEVKKSSIENYEDLIVNNDVFPFERLGINNLYFNAGVLFINYDLWIKKNIGDKLLKKMYSLGNNIIYWDQDVINSYTNGRYIQLEKGMNYYNSDVKEKTLQSEIVLIHYLGSKKPWKSSGIFTHDSKYYHQNYRKIYPDDFHITHQWKIYSIKQLLINIFNLNIIKIDKPISFIKHFIKSILSNRK